MDTVQELDLDGLVGRSVADARAAITAAGGTLRTATAGQALRADFRPERVTLLVEDDRVIRNLGIG